MKRNGLGCIDDSLKLSRDLTAPDRCADAGGLGARPRSSCQVRGGGRGPMMLTSSRGNAVFLNKKWELYFSPKLNSSIVKLGREASGLLGSL